METKGAKVLITGAGRGIGRAVARRLAEDGAHLVLVCRNIDEKLEKELKKHGAASVQTLEADLSSLEGVQGLIDVAKPLHIDILFNNAGQLTGGLLETQKIEEIYSMMQVNLMATIHLTHGLLPGMLKRKNGKIINHASVMGVLQLPCASTYSASKAAVIAFTNSLHQELKGTGVTTLTLLTPGVKTRMYDQLEPLFGRFLKIPKSAIPPERYAEMIREAIIEDIEMLNPSGLTGTVLQIAKYLPGVFQRGVSMGFNRS